MSSSLPTSASEAGKIVQAATALRIAAAKTAAATVAAKQLGTLNECSAPAHPTLAVTGGKKVAVDATSTQHVPVQCDQVAMVQCDQVAMVQCDQVAMADTAVEDSSSSVHEAAAKRKSQFQAKWNWAQWQEEAKSLLLHPPTSAHSVLDTHIHTHQRPNAATQGRGTNSLSSSAATGEATSKTAASASNKRERESNEAQVLEKKIKALQQVQHNTEALSKVAAQDASIKSEITSVMKHVKQVDKEKQSPTLAVSAHAKHTANKFTTESNGNVVATSLSKSTLKAMKEAQQAGWAADDAARQRAKAEAAQNYARIRDEMFRKDAAKQVQDENELRREKMAARAGAARGEQTTTNDDRKLVRSLDNVNRHHTLHHLLPPSDHSAALHKAVLHSSALASSSSIHASGSKKAGRAHTDAQPTTFGFLDHLFG